MGREATASVARLRALALTVEIDGEQRGVEPPPSSFFLAQRFGADSNTDGERCYRGIGRWPVCRLLCSASSAGVDCGDRWRARRSKSYRCRSRGWITYSVRRTEADLQDEEGLTYTSTASLAPSRLTGPCLPYLPPLSRASLCGHSQSKGKNNRGDIILIKDRNHQCIN